jgi:ABC-type transport system involved in multi-copper enzyme maturation permease subunit
MSGAIGGNTLRLSRNRIGAIARYTILEAWRNRLVLLVAAAVILLTLLSVFAKALAITESDRLQIAILAATLRVAGVFLITLYILNGLTREFNDKVIEMMLSLDLPRPGYLFGKFIGFAVIAIAVAAVLTLPVALMAPGSAALAWGASLAMELLIITALSVFCITTFSQLLPAAAFVAAFYLLARSISAIQLMSTSALIDTDAPGQTVARLLADGLALLLPRLDGFAQAAWLAGEPMAPGVLLAALAQTGIYITLLLAAAIFDFYRKNY